MVPWRRGSSGSYGFSRSSNWTYRIPAFEPCYARMPRLARPWHIFTTGERSKVRIKLITAQLAIWTIAHSLFSVLTFIFWYSSGRIEGLKTITYSSIADRYHTALDILAQVYYGESKDSLVWLTLLKNYTYPSFLRSLRAYIICILWTFVFGLSMFLSQMQTLYSQPVSLLRLMFILRLLLGNILS